MTTRSSTRPGRQKLALLIAVAAFALALAGLTGTAASAGDATAGTSRAGSVEINHFAFHPPTLRVAKGSTVTFSNASKVTHTATGGSFDTGLIKPGKSVSVRFKQKGTFAYHCEIHPLMHGKIIVN
ncbi:MAG TPA: plastocyanin/azurin family copper-binding protein [Solirubrobacterales bacterium]|jgi:plastocyanin|nr:plastocyanin/azurin family copper-binding protein [Solirubrobacterales bacterium]